MLGIRSPLLIGKELFYMKIKHSLYRNQQKPEEVIFHSYCLLFTFLYFSGLPSCLKFQQDTWIVFYKSWNRTLSFTCYCYFLFQFLGLILARPRAQQTNMPTPAKLCCQISIKSEIGLNLRKFTAGIEDFTLGEEWEQLTLER